MTRTPSSFEGCKQVDFTTAFSILPAHEPRTGNMAGSFSIQSALPGGRRLPNVDKEDKCNSDLCHSGTPLVCGVYALRADCEILNRNLVYVTHEDLDCRDRRARRVRQEHRGAFGRPAPGIHLHRFGRHVPGGGPVGPAFGHGPGRSASPGTTCKGSPYRAPGRPRAAERGGRDGRDPGSEGERSRLPRSGTAGRAPGIARRTAANRSKRSRGDGRPGYRDGGVSGSQGEDFPRRAARSAARNAGLRNWARRWRTSPANWTSATGGIAAARKLRSPRLPTPSIWTPPI